MQRFRRRLLGIGYLLLLLQCLVLAPESALAHQQAHEDDTAHKVDPETLLELSLNLQANRQYTIMAEYFLAHYPLTSQTFPQIPIEYHDDLKTLVSQTPIMDLRAKLLDAILLQWEKYFVGKPSVFYCLRGEIALVQADDDAAYADYKRCKSRLRAFSLGLIEQKRENFTTSIGWYNEALKARPSAAVKDEIYLALAHIYTGQMRYTEALKSARSSRPSRRRLMALYYIFTANKNNVAREKTLAELKANYGSHTETINLLAELSK